MDNHIARRSEILKRAERWPLELQQQFQALQDEYRAGKDGQAPMSKLASFTSAWDEIKPVVDEWEAENPDESEKDVDLLAKRSGSSNFDADFAWAYQNIGNEKVKAKDAPTQAAYFIWEYGREARKAFLDVALKYFTQKNKPDAEKKRFEDDQRRQMSILAKFDDCDKCPHCGGGLL